MTEASHAVVLIAAASREQAENIARLLLEERKAACVSVVPGMDSLYWWRGRLESACETLLLVKTRASLLPGVVETVKKVHSYEVPEIIALPVVGGNEDYLRWLDGEVRAE